MNTIQIEPNRIDNTQSLVSASFRSNCASQSNKTLGFVFVSQSTMRLTVSLAILFLLGETSISEAFVSPKLQKQVTALCLAKKASKQKKTAKTSSGAGFGASATNKQPVVGSSDDYAIFPALEPGVKETLVAAPGDGIPGELPNEIYQRLDQIYGFSQFNYEAHDDGDSDDGASLSFEDLLSGSFEEEEDEQSPEEDVYQISQLPPFEKLSVLHVDPLVLLVEDFFTPEECDAYVEMPLNAKKDEVFKTGSLTVGKDEKSKAQRTSTTWFSHYKNVPALMAKASRLLGLDGIDRWEEPQTVRYGLRSAN